MEKNKGLIWKLIRRVFRICLWITAIFIVLFISVALLIRLESVQNYLIHKATTFVSDRTHTKVAIGHISISFPKEIVLENIFLDDENKDTLISVGTIGINIEMLALLKNKLNISRLRIQDLNAGIHRNENDSLFNYSFLIRAFASDSTVKVVDSSAKPMEINIEDISLRNVNMSYADKPEGTLMKTSIGNLHVTTDLFNVTENKFHVDKVEVSDSYFQMKSKSKNTPENNDTASLPDFQLSELIVKNVKVSISDSKTGDEMNLSVGNCTAFPGKINLAESKANLKSLSVENSSFNIQSTSLEKEKIDNEKSNSAPWTFTAGKIDLVNIDFKMDNKDKPKSKSEFNPDHIDIKKLNAQIDNISFLPENMRANINSLSLKEHCGFELRSFKSHIVFTDRNAILEDFEMITPNSKIREYISIGYSSLKSISNSLGETRIKARLTDSYISTADVLFFSPTLKNQKFFSGAPKKIHLTAVASGKINDLFVPELMIAVGEQTQVRATLAIRGLPDAQNADYRIKIPYLSTTRNDIITFVPENIPTDKIPASIYLTGSFEGKLKNFNSDIFLRTSSGNLNAQIAMTPGTEDYKASLKCEEINLAYFLNDTMFGTVSMTAEVSGSSFERQKAVADIKANISSLELNKYVYKDIRINGNVAAEQFDGAVSIEDTNLALDFDGKISLKKNEELYAFNLNLKGADLKKLNLSSEDIRLSARANADLQGSSMNTFNGKAGITNLLVIKNGKSYSIDSVLFASVNEGGKSSFNFSSSIVTAKFEGTFTPDELGKVINHQINHYFDIGDTAKENNNPQSFTFEVGVKNHPLLREVILPDLVEFEPVKISGSLDSPNGVFIINGDVPRVEYSGFRIEGLHFNLHSDADKLNYSMSIKEGSNSTIKIISTSLSGTVQNNEASLIVHMKDSSSQEKMMLNAKLTSLREGDYHFTILPSGLSLNGTTWSVPPDNFVRFGKNGLLFNHFQLTNEDQLLSVNTPDQKINEEIRLEFKKFQLSTLSRLIEKDSSLVTGNLTGSLQTQKTNGVSAFVADIKISSLTFKEIPVGDIDLHADNISPLEYKATLKLSGNDNDVEVHAYYHASENPDLKIEAEIKSLSMNSLSAFSNGQMTNASGKIKGSVTVTGTSSEPNVKGSVTFENASFHSTFANNNFKLKNEKLSFDPQGIYFSKFNVEDSTGHTAVLNGSVYLNKFSFSRFDLDLRLNQFMALNSTKENNKLFYGKLILNSNTKITGSLALPKIYSKTKLIEGSTLTVIVPESKSSSDRGDGVVVFTDPNNKINPILTRESIREQTQSEITGLDLAADLEVDKNSTMKIIVDPVAGDSLVLKGDATLNFGIDPSGKTSLTGTYTVSEGSYRLALEGLISRKDFIIKKGSTISWSSGPMDAEINIDAIYEQKASPIDLVAGQIGGLSDQEKNTYKQVLPFQVILHMTGPLLKPIIRFEIELPPKYRGAMGGTVYAKLNQLNNDESELNKQVFALLVLGRFVQEDPLASSGGTALNSAARTSVSKLLSQQLNRFSDRYIKGVELNFDLQAYDDYSTGTAEAKTQLEVGLKKQLFNDKLSVEIGSMVDLSNNQGNTNEFASDVTLEYKLPPDGTYRVKVFHQNQYEDIIEGPLNLTGVGLIYTKDFDVWKDLFKRPEPEENITVPLKND